MNVEIPGWLFADHGLFDRVPDELVVSILDHVDNEDLFACRLVSHKINWACENLVRMRFIAKYGVVVAKRMFEFCQSERIWCLWAYSPDVPGLSDSDLRSRSDSNSTGPSLENGPHLPRPVSPNPSWLCISKLYSIDWCFYDIANIVNYSASDLIEIDAVDKVDRRELLSGVWKRIMNNSWGPSLLAANVHWLQLRFATALSPGTYKVTVNLRVRSLVNLFPIRFRVVGPENVASLKREFPPQDIRFIPTIDSDDQLTQDYLQGKAVSLCLGAIDVGPPDRECGQEGQPLTNVLLEIEESGMVIKRDLTFNYAYFDQTDSVSLQEQIGYFLRHDPIPREAITRDTNEAFKQLTALKLSMAPGDLGESEPAERTLRAPRLRY